MNTGVIILVALLAFAIFAVCCVFIASVIRRRQRLASLAASVTSDKDDGNVGPPKRVISHDASLDPQEESQSPSTASVPSVTSGKAVTFLSEFSAFPRRERNESIALSGIDPAYIDKLERYVTDSQLVSIVDDFRKSDEERLAAWYAFRKRKKSNKQLQDEIEKLKKKNR